MQITTSEEVKMEEAFQEGIATDDGYFFTGDELPVDVV